LPLPIAILLIYVRRKTHRMSSNQTPSTPSSSAFEDPISLAVGVAVEGSLATPIASQKADAVYRLKSVTYSAQSDGTFFASEKNRCQILLQNENGPCPLIAAMNVRSCCFGAV